jgi:hypothetical protein
MLALQRFFVATESDEHVVRRRHASRHLQPFQKGTSLRRAARPRLEDPACGPEPVRLREIAERRPGFGQQQPAASPRTSLPDAIPVDENRLQTRHRTRVGRGAAGEAAADNHDIAGMLAAEAWEFGSSRFGELSDPRRLAVPSGHQRNATPK